MISTVRQTDRHTDRLAQIDSILQSNLGRQADSRVDGQTNRQTWTKRRDREGESDRETEKWAESNKERGMARQRQGDRQTETQTGPPPKKHFSGRLDNQTGKTSRGGVCSLIDRWACRPQRERQTNIQAGKEVDSGRQADGQAGRHTHARTHAHTHTHMGVNKKTETDKLTDTDRQKHLTDRQTDKPHTFGAGHAGCKTTGGGVSARCTLGRVGGTLRTLSTSWTQAASASERNASVGGRHVHTWKS